MLKNGSKGMIAGNICRDRLPTSEWSLSKTGFDLENEEMSTFLMKSIMIFFLK